MSGESCSSLLGVETVELNTSESSKYKNKKNDHHGGRTRNHCLDPNLGEQHSTIELSGQFELQRRQLSIHYWANIPSMQRRVEMHA